MATITPRTATSDPPLPPSAEPSLPPGRSPAAISVGWLLRALFLTVALAAVLAYLAVYLLVYQGSWHSFLHPSHAIGPTPARLVIPFEPVAFDAAATGSPRLSGWWFDRTSAVYFRSPPGVKWTAVLPAPTSVSAPSDICASCPGTASIATIVRFLNAYIPNRHWFSLRTRYLLKVRL